MLIPYFPFFFTGTGTFGRVFLVKHTATGNFFALKVLRKMEVVRLKQVDHIKNEKKILAAINHPFIVSLYVFIQFLLLFFFCLNTKSCA